MTSSDIVSRLSITAPRSRALSTMLTVDKSIGTLRVLISLIWFLCPSHITCVLDELRRSRLELVMHRRRQHIRPGDLQPGSQRHRPMSSHRLDNRPRTGAAAYHDRLRPCSSRQYTGRRVGGCPRGPRTDPCGTSNCTGQMGDSWTVVGNLLCPAGNERRHPVQHVVCEAEVVLQSA